MSRITRRKFLGSAAAAPLGLGFAAESSAQGTPATGMASMIVTGANIYTMVWDNPKVTAIAVRGNRLLAVGNDEDIIRLANASTRRIDGRGMTVTPDRLTQSPAIRRGSRRRQRQSAAYR